MLSCFGDRAMKALEDSTGEGVLVNYVIAGKPRPVAGELRAVLRFRHIEVRTLDAIKMGSRGGANKTIVGTSLLRIPFIGMKVAIQKIEKGGNSEIIYDNFLIPDDYNLANPAGVLELKELLYGQNGQNEQTM